MNLILKMFNVHKGLKTVIVKSKKGSIKELITKLNKSVNAQYGQKSGWKLIAESWMETTKNFKN